MKVNWGAVGLAGLAGLGIFMVVKKKAAAKSEGGQAVLLTTTSVDELVAINSGGPARAFLRMEQPPTQDQINKLTAMGVKSYPESWIPPVGNFQTGYFIVEIPTTTSPEATKAKILALGFVKDVGWESYSTPQERVVTMSESEDEVGVMTSELILDGPIGGNNRPAVEPMLEFPVLGATRCPECGASFAVSPQGFADLARHRAERHGIVAPGPTDVLIGQDDISPQPFISTPQPITPIPLPYAPVLEPQPVVAPAILVKEEVGVRRLPPAGTALGDVDGDGWVTVMDADMVSEYLVGNRTITADQLARAKVRDGQNLTVFDSMFIAQYVNRTRDFFPAAPNAMGTIA